MNVKIRAVDKPSLAELELPMRICSQLPYFTVDDPNGNSAEASAKEHWFDLDQVKQLLDDGSFLVVSPLRAENAAEVELSEEAEELLEWIVANQVLHIRVTE